MPKQRRWTQKKLNFDTYVKHYALGPDPEVERQKKKEEQLKEIHEELEQITYKPKGLKKKEKSPEREESPEITYINGKYCPWGTLPEMYPGQHEGKPFLPGQISKE